ncbi:hypothetical protein L914_17719 [Phytophthora nicotianae]|uniref:Uncharacterized protein n=1 Tax=Phytophthora nicotianae TaxID=4792 RepID=W2MG63_PHYNI|nr:hypothetical protein L914_17719 [Phytophthora nicotianae]
MTTLNNLVARSHVQACQEKLFNHREKTAETANMSGTTKDYIPPSKYAAQTRA